MHRRVFDLSAAAALVVVALVALPRASRSADVPPLPDCIQYWGEARYRPYGYDHVVHITSACAADARCLVSTDVDPDPIRVTVASSSQIEIITRMGSPSREFTPSLVCRFVEP